MEKEDKIRIGLFGYGHLGKIHLSCLQATPFQIVGIYDPVYSENKIEEKSGIPFFPSEDELLSCIDAADIVTTTSAHKDLVEKVFTRNKHVFVEKPLTSTLEEAEELHRILPSEIVCQVGHVERFNPAFLSAKKYIHQPKFIESHRLAPIHQRGADVSVVFDLMIHDIDLILDLVQAPVEKVEASGISIINEKPDICNARITFEDGCVANITASRISMKQMRKIRVFEKNAYVSIDFLDKDSQIIHLEKVEDGGEEGAGMILDTFEGKKKMTIQSPDIRPTNAIVEELNEFHNCINDKKQPTVSFSDGYQSIKLAAWIEEEIHSNQVKHLMYSGRE